MNVTEVPTIAWVSRLIVAQVCFTEIMLGFLFIGIVANIMNCIVFRQTRFRDNACATFCTAASTTNIFILLQGAIGTILSLTLNPDPENYILFYCKTCLYFRHTMMMMNRSYTILACAACFALSSQTVYLRTLIRRSHIIHCCIVTCVVMWPLLSIHVCLMTTLENQQCILINSYPLIFAIYLFIIAGIICPILLIVFSLLTLNNLKQLRQRIQPAATHNLNMSTRSRKRDFQLIRMLLVHVIIYIMSTFLYPINLFYTAITNNISNKNSERIAIESFITFLTNNFIFYLNNIAPFFIYYCASDTFRDEWRTVMMKWLNRIRATVSNRVM